VPENQSPTKGESTRRLIAGWKNLTGLLITKGVNVNIKQGAMHFECIHMLTSSDAIAAPMGESSEDTV
jgi:hypothetical protein